MSTPSPTPPSAADQRIKELEAQVAQLRGQLAEPAKAPQEGSRHRGRSFLAALLIIVACLLAPLSVVSVWASGEVSDTDRYVQTVAPLASNPDVQDAVANRITDEIFTYIDVQALTKEAVDTISANRNLTARQTAALTALTGPINSGIQSFTEDKVTQVVQSEAFATAWTKANTMAHQALVAALSGQDNGAVEVANNQVSLNLGDLVTEVKNELVANGFTIAEKIPAVDAQVVIFESPDIGRLQNAYALLNALGVWLPIITIAIGVIGIFVANNRNHAMIGLGVGLFLAMLVSAGLLVFARAEYLSALPDTVNTAAATAIFDQVSLYLREALRAGAVAGVVLALGGLMLGSNALGRGVRGLAVRSAAAIQREIASWGAGMDAVRSWVARSATGLRIAAGIGALAVIFIQRYKTPELVLWTTVGLLVVLFVIQVLASGTDSEPEPETEPVI